MVSVLAATALRLPSQRGVEEPEHPDADLLQAPQVGVDPRDLLPQRLSSVGLPDPVGEIPARMPAAALRFERVEVDRTGIHFGEALPELPKGPRLKPGGNLDHMGLDEEERVPEDNPGDGRECRDVVIDDRHELVPQRLEAAEGKWVHDGQALAKYLVPDLGGDPV